MRYPRYLTAGLVAASLTGGAVAGALVFTPALSGAQEAGAEDDGPARRHVRPGLLALDVVADAIGIDTSALREAVRDGQTLAEVAEANGVDVQVVIDALVAEATERITDLVDEPLPAGPRRPGHHGRGLHVALDVAADAIGIDESALREALRDGETLAEVAEANGASRDALVAALVEAAHDRIDEKVAEGDLTEEEAAVRRARAEERIEALVDGELRSRRGPR